jgi:hypothetical protein
VAVNTCVIPASRSDVLDVLNDAHAYSEWVVGPRRVVTADPSWPRPGSSFVHEERVGPAEVQDETEMVSEDPSTVVLCAKMRPFGAKLRIQIDLTDVDGGTRVVMDERPVEGPVAAIWNPVFDAAMWLRNVVALRRLSDLVVRRASSRGRLT